MLRLISLLVLIVFALEASPPTLKETPFEELEVLISSTEKLVEKQKSLLKQLQEYLTLHDAYLQDTENRELLLRTAKKAQQALDQIKAERLSYLFSTNFISEMTLFAKLAGRPSIPLPP